MTMKNYTNMPKLVHDASGWFGRTRSGSPGRDLAGVMRLRRTARRRAEDMPG